MTLHNIGIDRGDFFEKEGDDGEDEVNQGHDRVLPVGIGWLEGVWRHIVETYFA